MDNRYNQQLVEKFRKGEIVLEFPHINPTRQDLVDLHEISQKPEWTGESEVYFLPYEGTYLNRLKIPLSDFIENVDVVVNTKQGLEKIVADNLKDIISMIESFNYEVRKLADGEIRRGTKVWVRYNEEEDWKLAEYLLFEPKLSEYQHKVFDKKHQNIFSYSFVTTSDPYAVPKLTRKEICDKFGIDNFEIVED